MNNDFKARSQENLNIKISISYLTCI